MEEIPLTGGTVAAVVRMGDTVRRPTERWSEAVHGLLLHLEAAGFRGAPRYLGHDDQGREVLSWVEGAAAQRPWPPELLTLEGLSGLARLLRGYHDAVASYLPGPDAEWWIGKRPLRNGEIVTHGDLGPWNSIWRNGRPVAFVDWDFAEPGPPVADLAGLALFAVPLRDDDHCYECGFDQVPDRRARLGALCDAYGWDDHAAVLDEADRFWSRDIERIATYGPQGIKPWDGFLARGLIEEGQRFQRWLRSYRPQLGV